MPHYICPQCDREYEDSSYATNQAGEPICNNLDCEEALLELVTAADTESDSAGVDEQEVEPVHVCRAHRDSESGNQICYSCPTIEIYIEAVEAAEAVFYDATPHQMITALRKEWAGGAFDGGLFSWVLEGADTPPLDCGNERHGFEISHRWALACVECLWTELHGCIEFGHVLCGIDATNNPSPNPLIRDRLPTSGDVIAAVTWAGDLGAAYKHMRGSDWRESSLIPQEALDQEAALDDLLGDVDGVVLGRIHRQTERDRPFSQQLRDYYLRGAAGNQAAIFDRFVNRIYRGTDGTDWRRYTENFIMGSAVFRSWSTTINEDNINLALRAWRGFIESGLGGRNRHNHIMNQAMANHEALQRIR